jgi:hypothetical protein
LIEYQANLDEALEGLSLAYLESLTFRNRLALDAVPHKIFMLRRLTIDVDSVLVYIQPISPFIASKVARRMRALKRHELVSLFERYNALPSTRRMSGDVFEAYYFLNEDRVRLRPDGTYWWTAHSQGKEDASVVFESYRV